MIDSSFVKDPDGSVHKVGPNGSQSQYPCARLRLFVRVRRREGIWFCFDEYMAIFG